MTQPQAYGVIFDMDGVLIDSYEQHRQSWKRMAREYGLEMTDEQFAATFGKPSAAIIRQVWGDTVLPNQVAPMDDRKEEIYRELLREALPIMPGAQELIRDLVDHGFAIGIGSSGPPENVGLVVQGLGIRDVIRGVTTGKDVTHGKPDPQVFLLTAEKMGIPPARCVVVEDAVHGITAAKRANMKAVALTGTATREQLAEADIVVDDLTALSAKRLAGLIDGQTT